MNCQLIGTIELYNLYNQEAFIMDFSDDLIKINMTIKVTQENFIEELDNYSPDNRENIVLINCFDFYDKIEQINKIMKFKKYNIFIGDKNNIFSEFPVLFNGNDQIYPSYISFLPQRLFLGSIKTVNRDFVSSMNIKHVINLTLKSINLDNVIEYNFPVDDDEDVDLHAILCETYKILDSRKDILVICEKGQSRSVSIVLDYYSKKYNVKKFEALDTLKTCRPMCSPNKGFMRQIGI